MAFTEAELQDQTGKHFVVTGANTGLGFDTARALAQKGARVSLACRSRAKAESAMERIRRTAPAADLLFVELDLGDLDQVKDASDTIRKLGKLDVLINNAGLMIPPLERTRQGFESQMGVNHFGHFALVGELSDKILQDDTRVVVLSSLAHTGGVIDWDDLHANKRYHAMRRYQASKLANMLFGLELERRLRARQTGAKSVICHPGVAATELMRHLPRPLQFVATPAVNSLFNTPAEGAWPTLLAATEDVEGGSYWGPMGIMEARGKAGPARIARRARREDTARRLWELSVEQTGVDPKF